ncbi:MAG: hypothetical protein FWH14_00640 [Oscillospiraceae bacterium]|nr:hypothetical protein [Oscillospiraceae bacterium]
MKPELITGKYSTDDMAVAVVHGRDYALDHTGESDSATAIQQMIDDCKEAGGGVVYLPEGRYALRSYLTIKTGVTLRGEWINPDRENPQDRGTILHCYCGRNDREFTPQITMESCTGLVNMTIYYPEQNLDNPVPYSPTVRQRGIDSITLRNVTLVNPWIGVQCGPTGNELHYLKNVYMTPLHTGMFMDMTTDIGRLENLYISPKYLEQFESMSMQDSDKLRDYMADNTTGIFMARSDWEYGYNVNIQGCRIGFLITSLTSVAPNAQFSQLNIHNCRTGFNLINVNPYGVALSDSSITADSDGEKRGLLAAIASESSFETVMQINGVDFSGPYKNMVVQGGRGQLSFANCTFCGWSDTAIVQNNGGLSLLGCKFSGEGAHLEIKDGVSGTQILGCDFGGEARNKIGVKAQNQLQYSDDPLNLPVMPRGGHKPYPYPLCPAANLYTVDNFGALADGETDNTASFQAALDKAGQTGGIVYVPAGLYRFDGQLTVPDNVEIRGSFDVPCHTMGGGSVLQPFADKGDQDGTPFITLGEKSGVRGLVINHPEQDPVEPVEYPWAIQANGDYCYVIDTVFVNAWLGVDFGTYGSKNHYVSYISGAPIRCGIYCGNNSSEGWVENIQYNPHYLYRSSLPGKPDRKTWHSFWMNQIKHLDALKFGYNENVHLLGTFVFAAKHGLYFADQDGKGTKGRFIGHGTDGGEQGLNIDGFTEIDFINTELVTIASPDTKIYIEVTPNADGRSVFYNTLMWGNPDRAVLIGGGDTEFQQINYVDQGQMANTVTGGRLKVTGAYFYSTDNHLSQSGGETDFTANMAAKKETPHDGGIIDAAVTGGVFNERLNWRK